MVTLGCQTEQPFSFGTVSNRTINCIDEVCRQLIGTASKLLYLEAELPQWFDNEDVRNGIGQRFMMCALQQDWSAMHDTQQQTVVDVAAGVGWLVKDALSRRCDWYAGDCQHEQAPTDHVGCGHIARACPVAHQMFERHYWPMHGSWLNRAAIEHWAKARHGQVRRLKPCDAQESAMAAWLVVEQSMGCGSAQPVIKLALFT